MKLTIEEINEAANKHTDLQYPMGVEREYPIADFKAGANWAIEKLSIHIQNLENSLKLSIENLTAVTRKK